jgi:cytoskeletal protein RodZ
LGKLKKALTVLLALLTMTATAVSTGVTPVNAESGSWSLTSHSSLSNNGLLNGYTTSIPSEATLHVLALNGVGIGFCADAEKGVSGSYPYVSRDYEENTTRIAYAYYGSTGAPSGQEATYYAAAQRLIWGLYWEAKGGSMSGRVTGTHAAEVAAAEQDIVNKYNSEKGQYTYYGYVYHSQSSADQDILSSAARKQNAKDVPVSVSVHKYSVDPSVTDNNPCYSLAGAVFNVYQSWDGAFVTQITTDENGNASYSKTYTGIPYDTDTSGWSFRLTEATPSKGYLVNNGSWTPGNGGTANVPETFANDPVAVKINKVSEDGTLLSGDVPSLEGAEFTLKYYAVDPDSVNSVSDLPSTPTKTWVITSQKVGNDYYAYLLDAFLDTDKSDELYKYRNTTVLPLGVLTIQETKAPTDGAYTLENKTLDVNGNTVTKENDVALVKCIPDTTQGSGAKINYGNEYTASEENVRTGSVEIHKYLEYTGTTLQGDMSDLTTTFKVSK